VENGLFIVDNYSIYTWTLFIVTRNNAFTTFKRLVRILQNENNNSISAIKTDHGGEFQNEKIDKFCEKYSIKYNFQYLEHHNKMIW